MKTITVDWTNESYEERSKVEHMITAWQNFGFSYDLETEAELAICDTLTEMGLDYHRENDNDNDLEEDYDEAYYGR